MLTFFVLHFVFHSLFKQNKIICTSSLEEFNLHLVGVAQNSAKEVPIKQISRVSVEKQIYNKNVVDFCGPTVFFVYNFSACLFDRHAHHVHLIGTFDSKMNIFLVFEVHLFQNMICKFKNV